MNSTPSFTTAIQPPPGPNLVLPTTSPNININPPTFNNAMQVRMHVFVDEQNCSADAEIDSDDQRSWHWVITDTKKGEPIAVIRLVPPPQPPHETLTHPETSQTLPEYDWAHEPCIKLTRVAVLPEYRGLGLGRQLVDIALKWAGTHAGEIDAAIRDVAGQSRQSGLEEIKWNGLVLVHAQVDVEKMYQRLGFETDDSLGRWDEEGIEHVGMFKRISLHNSLES
ncbi:hypothetical protein PENSTE_c033G06592 [Penicillium steckii]|uniref:Glucosamine 6-phosphate N-acetyltransferase n=1 Tax=Penicillium steckii TaxID=303698 RepID=A0A1V6SM44_9EURO|nr:hypothetical protein PENSTE_c033G06592 [Penicillium steckii]